jgi:Tfp pilus assembly protein PilO
MWESFLLNWSQIVIALGVIISALIACFRFFILRPLVRLIDDRTKEIQPESNGGWSLSDLHRRMDKIEARFDSLEEKLPKSRRKKETPDS